MDRRKVKEIRKDLQVNDLWLEFLGTPKLLRISTVPSAMKILFQEVRCGYRQEMGKTNTHPETLSVATGTWADSLPCS